MLTGEASMTAKICAFARAHHSLYSQPTVCDDYLAYELLGEQEYERIKKNIIKVLSDKCWEIPTLDTWDRFLNELISPVVLPRMKYTEEQLQQFAEENDEVQYVICGAGLDSFLFRNENSGIHVFELDHPDTQQFKVQRIQELGWEVPSNVALVPIDFERQDMKTVLLKAGFRPERKTFVAILGVAYYLQLETLAETFANIAAITNSETRVVLDYPDKSELTYARAQCRERMQALMDITASLGENMADGHTFEKMRAAMEKAGFQIREHVTPIAIQNQYFTGQQDRKQENSNSSGYSALRAYENIDFIYAVKR